MDFLGEDHVEVIKTLCKWKKAKYCIYFYGKGFLTFRETISKSHKFALFSSNRGFLSSINNFNHDFQFLTKNEAKKVEDEMEAVNEVMLT